jgi:group II intron reverse transcriptase/maturase
VWSFDTINHRVLMKLLRRRVRDERLLQLIWKYLRAGVMEKKLFRDTQHGTPQGGIASPLLANIYLHELDRYMQRYTGLSLPEKTKRRKAGQANFAYIRYCDDFVVLCNGRREHAEALKEEFYTFLRRELKLTLSKEKTKVTHLNDGCKFLGFWIERSMGQKGITTKVLIPPEAFQQCREKISTITDASTHEHSVTTKILAINRIIGGWCRYYQYCTSASTTFGKLEYHVFWSMAHWLGRKFQLTMPQVMTGLWRFFAVLRWFTQKTLQDGEIIAQFGRLLAGRL